MGSAGSQEVQVTGVFQEFYDIDLLRRRACLSSLLSGFRCTG